MSLTTKAALVALTLVTILVGGFLLAGRYYVLEQRQRALDNEADVARNVAADLSRLLENGAARLRTVSELPVLRYGFGALQESPAATVFPAWTTLHYMFFESDVFGGGVYLLGQRGEIRWEEPPDASLAGRPYPAYPEIVRALEQHPDDPVVPVWRRGPDGAEILLSAPVVDSEGLRVGVLVGAVPLTHQVFATAGQQMESLDMQSAHLVTEDGGVVWSTGTAGAAPPDGWLRAARGQAPGAVELDTDAGPTVVGAAQLAWWPDWTVLSGRSSQETFQDVRRLEYLQWIFAGLGTVFGLLGILFITTSFTRPILHLTGAALRRRAGDPNARFALDRRDEIGVLAQTLDAMSAELDRSLAQTRERDARTTAMLDHMLEGLFVVDGDSKILQANRAFARLFGFDEAELPGTSITDLIPGLAGRHRPGQFAEVPQGSLGRVTEREGRRRTGARFPMALQIYEVSIEGRSLVAGHVCDLSQEREVERLKERFVASVSHELRTPLTAIRGALGLLVHDATGALPVTARELVTLADRNAVRLADIINDLLDFERLQSGSFSVTRERFALDAVIAGMLDSVSGAANKAGIEIVTAPCGVGVYGDRARVEQVLLNLVTNAIKFSPPGTAVEIQAAGHDDHVEVRVCDRGRGIPPAHRALIFEAFRQVDESDARTFGGAGLGLAICRTLVRQHGGEIGVEGRPGGGSIFWFTLPLDASDARATR